MMWTCGWWVSAEPQVCSTAVEADARAEMLRVGGDRGQRLGGGPEQEVVDGRLVLEGDVADLGRQGEDDVIVGNRQQLRLAVCEPSSRRRRLALRAVPVAAGVVGDRVRARSPRSARRGRRARPCDRSRSPTSPSAGRGSRDRRWPRATPAPWRAEDVGDLQRRGRATRPAVRRAAFASSALTRLSRSQRALDCRGPCWRRRGCSARSCPAWRARAATRHNAHLSMSLKVKALLRGIGC